jgi:hypothetical protein
MVNGGTYRGGRMFATGAGSITHGVRVNMAGTALIEDATFENTTIPVYMQDAGDVADIRRTTFVTPPTAAVIVHGGEITIRNSLITTTENAAALKAYANSDLSGSIVADHLTVVRTGGAATAAPVQVEVQAGETGSESVTVTNSIFRGYASGWHRNAPVGAATGNANLVMQYSNHLPTGTGSGDGTLSTTTGAINADPLFAGAGDYRLSAGSPSIDAGDPGAGTDQPDLDGNPRVLDGTNDCDLRRDMGAYEFQAGECDAPVITGSSGSVAVMGGGEAVGVDPNITISDADGDMLVSGTVVLTDPEPGDQLLYETTGGVTGAISAAKDSVSFTAGPYTPAALAAAMSAVRFQSAAGAPAGERSVTFRVNDGKLDSNLLTRTLAVDVPAGGGDGPGGGGDQPGGGEPGDQPGGGEPGASGKLELLGVKRRRNATVTLTLRVPAAGLVKVSDRRRRIRRARRSVDGAQDIKLRLKLRRGKPRRVKALVRYTPRSGEPTVLRVRLRFRRAR